MTLQHISARTLESASGQAITVPDPDRLVHLQFRRFAGCPICNLHLRTFTIRHRELEQASIREVVIFHSPLDELAPHTAGLPFAAIPDPHRSLYREFGVESSPRSLLHPKALAAAVRGIAHDLRPALTGRQPWPSLRPTGGRLGLPADFLIASDGTVLASKHGRHANDHWSVDEVLALATTNTTSTRSSAAR